MSARRIRAGEYRRARWKNGGGWTTELAAAPAGAEAFDWRISIAEIDSDGAFSTFPGCDRHIALLDGPGMQIDFDESTPLVLDQRLKFLQISGEWMARGRLLGGAVRDFNVIVRRAAFQAEVLHRPLVGPMVFLPEAKTTWFIYVASGRAELKDVGGMDLEAGDSLLLEHEGEARNRVLSGGGEVVLVKLTRA
jgi:environmental stress-induced protein Ves